jgi:hypothetical protein
MPRTHTLGQRTQIAAPTLNHHVRVKVANGSGTMINICALEGINWLGDWEVSNSLDAGTATFSFQVKRESSIDDISMSPFWGGSPINRDDLAVYSPLLYPGRNVEIEVAVTAAGVAPIAGRLASSDLRPDRRGLIRW